MYFVKILISSVSSEAVKKIKNGTDLWFL